MIFVQRLMVISKQVLPPNLVARICAGFFIICFIYVFAVGNPEGRVWILLKDLTPPRFCDRPKPAPEMPTP